MNEPSEHRPRRACLVTGGSSGIGLAIAKKFARQGYRVAICGRDGNRLQQAISQIRETASREFETNHAADIVDETCLAERVDLADRDQTIQFAEKVISKFGSLDVLINNAAAAPLGAFESIQAEEFETTLDVNVRSVFYLTQAIWRYWTRETHLEPDRISGQARTIINISSLAAIDPFPNFSIYGASKAWMDLMTHALSIEGTPHGIRVCSVRPGAVETPLLRGLFPDFPADQCASPASVAELVWNCANQPAQFPSGRAFTLS